MRVGTYLCLSTQLLSWGLRETSLSLSPELRRNHGVLVRVSLLWRYTNHLHPFYTARDIIFNTARHYPRPSQLRPHSWMSLFRIRSIMIWIPKFIFIWQFWT